jgi:zinc protease
MPNEYAYSKVFFERWYRPQYTTVIIAGDVVPERVLPIVEKYWGGWKSGSGAAAVIPPEPPPAGPQYVHVPWASETLPWVSVAFPGPAFNENSKDSAAVAMLGTLAFGETSSLYRKLVVAEQKVDELGVDVPSSFDPSLFTVFARVKNVGDTVYVRDQILATFAEAVRGGIVTSASGLDAAKSNSRYSFARTIDSSERVASVLASFTAYKRSYQTVNNYYRTLDSLGFQDLAATARKYFTDRGLIVTTLSKEPLPAAIEKAPLLASFRSQGPDAAGTAKAEPAGAPPAPAAALPAAELDSARVVMQKSASPLINIKLLFNAGSAHDPAGKEGLAALTAAMLTDAGSTALTIDQIDKLLYPMAGSFAARSDKEMTVLTGIVHRDNWRRFLDVILPQLLSPGWRAEDFERLKTRQQNALVQDLRSNNEEELGKERLQTNIFRGTPYGHVVLGTEAGLRSVTLDDVKAFARQAFTRANLTLGISGDAPDDLVRELRARLSSLPEGTPAPRAAAIGERPRGIEVEILEKETRATAISFGFPIDVTRSHPDFAALSVARSWLGEHRLSTGRLYQRIREERGINYGDYAYIEAFPRGMFQFFPDSNVARGHQIFEIWIRPVVPVNAHMTLRLAIHELDGLVEKGLTRADFESSRDYLMKNVFVMTARQDQQLGYALDSRWYGTGEFTEYLRGKLQSLTLEQVNAAIKRHLTPQKLSVVIVTKDAAALKQALVTDAPSPIKYDGEKPSELLEEDRVIGALKLNIAESDVRITPINQVFAR